MKFVQIYAKLWFSENILDDFSRKRRRSRKLISHILPILTNFFANFAFSWKMEKGMFHFKPRLGSVYPSVHVPGTWWKVIQFIIPGCQQLQQYSVFFSLEHDCEEINKMPLCQEARIREAGPGWAHGESRALQRNFFPPPPPPPPWCKLPARYFSRFGRIINDFLIQNQNFTNEAWHYI